jgi:hypothetical protein
VGEVEVPLASLRITAARGRSTTTAEAQLLGVPGTLADLFPDGGIRRGSTVAVGPLSGGCSLALYLAAAVTKSGGWAAVVGMPSLGLVAAAEIGVDLARLALIPEPGEQWAGVVAALVDGFDLVLLRPPARARSGDARRLAARVRERRCVLTLLDAPGWPETPDIRLMVKASQWEGLAVGYGLLRARRMEVVAGGRRLAGRERHRSFWLPAADEELEDPAPQVSPPQIVERVG